jgi:trk system potassium uptake protein TrkH
MPEYPRPIRKPRSKITLAPLSRPWRVLLESSSWQKNRATPALLLIYGFAGMIALGTLLLVLPIASKSGQLTSFTNALFTATSAVCVTGLVIVDTYDYWSLFGQIVIFFLIQFGGFGFMTSATLLLLAFRRRIGLRERLLIGESVGLTRIGGLVKLIRQMAIFTLVAEGTGAIVFLFKFLALYPPGTAIWKSLFHSISSFNNAGFDLFGGFQSLASFRTDPVVILMTAILIIIGGVSYLVLSDLLTNRTLGKISLDSKIVLTTTGILLILGTGVLLLTDFNNPATFGSLPASGKLLDAFFLSVTSRTAGFSTINMGNVAAHTLFFIMLLMFVGGASGSTAGGIKVNTFGMLIATIWSTLRGKDHAGAFGRQFTQQQINRALTVIMLSIGLISIAVLLLTFTESFRFIDLLFEIFSAFGTVGLSTGITPELSIIGKFIVTLTMFAGRLGPLTVGLALIQSQQPATYHYPEETIRIG